MNYISKAIILISLILSIGCSSNGAMHYEQSPSQAKSSLAHPTNARLIQKSASLGIDVDSVKDSIEKVYEVISAIDGYVDSTNNYSEESASIVAKVPSESLNMAIQELGKIGDVTYEAIRIQDVTDEVIDIEARLKNLIELRARFRKLLDKADKVDEILSIERELSRIQTEIDSIESRKAMLMGDVDQSQIDIKLEQKTVLGPLGLLGKGLLWGISKLFVIK